MSGDSIMSLDRRKQKGGERSERGSALLIVFVFAAIVAIMLYKEMPVSAFEARRQKEELLIDRGNEYKHAIKIYVRKIGSFPPSMEALENTNRMRFLRHKFDDPITGKNDWRILHAGPNGMIVDSKIPGANGAMGKTAASAGNTTLGSSEFNNSTFNNTAGGNNNMTSNGMGSSMNNGVNNTVNNPGRANNSNSSFGSSNSFGGTSSSGFGSFGSSSFGSAGSGSSVSGPTIAAVPQRGPAVSAGSPMGMTTLNADPAMIAANGQMVTAAADPSAPIPAPNLQIAGTYGDVESQMRGLANNQNPTAAQMAQTTAMGNTMNTPTANTMNGQTGTGMVSPAFGGSSNGSSFGNNSTTGSSGFGAGTTGRLNAGGGIAGVASIAVGKTIKTVNEQTNFSLWEFYFDMAKEANSALAGAMGKAAGTGVTQNQTGAAMTGSSFGNSNGSGSSSGFGSSSFGSTGNSRGSNSGNSSGFGSSSFGSSSFGTNSGSGSNGFGSNGIGSQPTTTQGTPTPLPPTSIPSTPVIPPE